MVLFLAMGIFTTVYPDTLLTSCQNSKVNSTQDFQVAVVAAQQILCKSCGCYFPTLNSSFYNDTGSCRNKAEKAWLLVNLYNTTANASEGWVENAQNCSAWSNVSDPDVETLSLLEGVFSCSGWCKQPDNPNLYYLFTNLNQGSRWLSVGKPHDFCYVMVVKFFEQFGFLLEVSSYLVASVLFVVLLTTICLCVHPKRLLLTDSNASLKQRLLQINATILGRSEDVS